MFPNNKEPETLDEYKIAYHELRVMYSSLKNERDDLVSTLSRAEFCKEVIVSQGHIGANSGKMRRKRN